MRPPSETTHWPVMKPDSSEARNLTKPAMSSGWPTRPVIDRPDALSIIRCLSSGLFPSIGMSVITSPGNTALTVIPLDLNGRFVADVGLQGERSAT